LFVVGAAAVKSTPFKVTEVVSSAMTIRLPRIGAPLIENVSVKVTEVPLAGDTYPGADGSPEFTFEIQDVPANAAPHCGLGAMAMVGVELLFWVAALLAKVIVPPKQLDATERPRTKIDLLMSEEVCMNP